MVFHGTVTQVKPYPACILVLDVNGEIKEHEWTINAGKYCASKKPGDRVVFGLTDGKISYISDESTYVDKPKTTPKSGGKPSTQRQQYQSRSDDDGITENQHRIGLQSNLNTAVAILQLPNSGVETMDLNAKLSKVLEIAGTLDDWCIDRVTKGRNAR